MESNETSMPAKHDFGPVGMKGRNILRDGVWVMLKFANNVYKAKLTTKDLYRAMTGRNFQAWHVTVTGPEGPTYLPSATKTLDPWNMNGRSLDHIAVFHPDQASIIDEMNTRSLTEDPSAPIATPTPQETIAINAEKKRGAKGPSRLIL